MAADEDGRAEDATAGHEAGPAASTGSAADGSDATVGTSRDTEAPHGAAGGDADAGGDAEPGDHAVGGSGPDDVVGGASTDAAAAEGASPAAGAEDGADTHDDAVHQGAGGVGSDAGTAAEATTQVPATEAPTTTVPPVGAASATAGSESDRGAATDAPTVAVPPTEAATTRVPPVAPPPGGRPGPLDGPTVAVPPAGPENPPPAPPPGGGAAAEPEPSGRRRAPVVAVLVAAVIVVAGLAVWLLSGSSSGSAPGTPGAGGSAGSTAQAAPAAQVTLSPAAGATGIAPAAPATVTVAQGKLSAVTLTGSDGKAVAGRPTADGWTTTGPLVYGTTYTWQGTAVDASGQQTPVAGTFSTVSPQQKVSASVNIGEGDTVGVGAPIILQFDGKVADKAAVEKALSVQTSVPTEGSWAWLPDTEEGSRVHWRPKEYWKPGTQVQVAANLYGTNAGGGDWGGADLTTHFTIGRSQIVKADVNSFQMVVVRDGQTVMTLPASYGLGSDPNRNTTNGIHVVMSKEANKLMTNPAYGYFNVPEKWAVRISNNGEFIHANPKSTSAQGNDNVTHGCVNLSTQDAQAYFDTAMYGDPVEVTGSPQPMPQTDIYDWTVPWDQWTKMSALSS